MKIEETFKKNPFTHGIFKSYGKRVLDKVEEKVSGSDLFYGISCFHYLDKDLKMVMENSLEELVQDILPELYVSGQRCRFIYKSPFKPYKDNNEVCFDVVGNLGRSGGSIKVPLVIYNKRSLGGPELSINNLVRIIESKKPHKVIWEYKTKTQ